MTRKEVKFSFPNREGWSVIIKSDNKKGGQENVDKRHPKNGYGSSNGH